MSQTTRIIFTILAVAVGSILAPDVLHIFPLWAQVLAGALAAGLAAVGIIPPQVPGHVTVATVATVSRQPYPPA